jgi:hypothetical protein
VSNRHHRAGPAGCGEVVSHPGEDLRCPLEVIQEPSVRKPVGDLPSCGHRLVGGHDPAEPLDGNTQLLSSQDRRQLVVLLIDFGRRTPDVAEPPTSPPAVWFARGGSVAQSAYRTAPQTFPSRTLARRWLSLTEADMVRGQWRDPSARTETLRVYAVRWVVERELSDRTREPYLGLLERQVLPSLANIDLTLITPPRVRAWRQDLLDSGTGASTVAKAYRLLRAVMNTAVDDEVIGRNPCRIKGAGVEPTPERPVIGVEAVLALADALPERYRALILLATFGSLRWGELMGLRKSDIDLNEAAVSIERSVVEVGGGMVVKDPKTAAGVRTTRCHGP